jgi:chromate transporter
MELPDKSTLTRERSAGNRGQILGPPSLPDLFLSFLRLGVVSFGGPAMVAYIGRLAVTRKAWLSDRDFKAGVALCQVIPGATAMQCAAYVGLRTRGLAGSVAAYVGFGVPAFLLMLAASVAYQRAIGLHAVYSSLIGLRCIVVAVVVNAAWTFARSSFRGLRDAVLEVGAAALFLMGGSPFLIVLGAGVLGPVILGRQTPVVHDPSASSGWRSLRAPLIVLAVAAGSVALLFVLAPQLAILGLVMMKVDAFAFGGGFASVPLMFREVVHARAWMLADTFMDGIALGQITPGPIVITATFVGYQVAGLAGAAVATAGIFLPSIFVVTLVEPWFRRLNESKVFGAVSRALLLSFVGLLASVAIQFAIVAPWSLPSVVLSGVALAALLLKVDVLWVLLIGGVLAAFVL